MWSWTPNWLPCLLPNSAAASIYASDATVSTAVLTNAAAAVATAAETTGTTGSIAQCTTVVHCALCCIAACCSPSLLAIRARTKGCLCCLILQPPRPTLHTMQHVHVDAALTTSCVALGVGGQGV